MPGSARPIIDAGIGAVDGDDRAAGEFDVGEEALVAADEPGFDERGGEAHRAARHSTSARPGAGAPSRPPGCGIAVERAR